LKEWTEADRQSLRDAVDDKLAAHGHPPIASADFAFAFSTDWARALEEDNEEDLAEEIAFRVMEWRERDLQSYSPRRPEQVITLGDGKEFPLPPEGPSWWAEESRRRFERFRKAQAAALSLIGRPQESASPQFLAVDELFGVLASLAKEQRTGGDLFSLEVPAGRDEDAGAYHPEELRVWRGRRAVSDSQEHEEQPLWRLAELVSHVDAVTGCGEPEALLFLLCNEVPRIPWVGARYEPQRGVITLSVRHPRVSPTDVAIAYSSMRDAFFGKKRRGSEWPWVAKRLCTQLKEDAEWQGWAHAFALFSARHPDQPYKNSASFYYAVHTLQKRLGEVI